MMLRISVRPIALCLGHGKPTGVAFARLFSSQKEPVTFTSEELEQARRWLAALQPKYFPRKMCYESFSRSSGPGGQNVNMTNSKATLRVNVARLLTRVPPPLHSEILTCRYYSPKTHSLVIHADDSRKRTANLESCYVRLVNIFKQAAAKVIPGETPTEKIERVKKLKNDAEKARKRAKEFHSDKKNARRSGWGDY